MRRLFLLVLMPLFLFAGSSCLFAAEANQTPTDKVVVYYFHGSMRCATCQKLERYSQGAVQEKFKDALASGLMEFKAVNLDEKGNEHFVNDYQLYTKSLVLSRVVGGKEVKYKNLPRIWELVGNEREFYRYVQGEVAGFMNEAAR